MIFDPNFIEVIEFNPKNLIQTQMRIDSTKMINCNTTLEILKWINRNTTLEILTQVWEGEYVVKLR